MRHQQTEIISIDPIHPEPAIIEQAAALLRAGELVAFPTETVYGLGADALQTHAVEGIFAAKERPLSDPLIVHIADEDELEQLVTHIPPEARLLARTCWPGPLTIILPARPLVPRLVTAGLETVALRMPRHPVARALIRALGSPIAAPSANRFTHVSPTTAQHVFTDLHGRIPLILDGGPCEIGVESTVLDLCSDVPTILRPGGVSLEVLQTILPQVQPPVRRHAPQSSIHDDAAAHKSPGQLLIHYAPAVPLLLFEGPVEAMRSAMLTEALQRQTHNERIGILVADEDLASFQGHNLSIYTLGNANSPEHIATCLFAGMRTLEEAQVQIILCRTFDEQGLGLAIRDRLFKAAGGKIFKYV